MNSSSRFEYLWLVAGLLLAVGMGLFATRALPPFTALFAGSGIELPAATAWLLRTPWLPLALPLPVLLAWWCWPRAASRGRAALVVGGLLVLLVPLLLLALMYWPIARL